MGGAARPIGRQEGARLLGRAASQSPIQSHASGQDHASGSGGCSRWASRISSHSSRTAPSPPFASVT